MGRNIRTVPGGGANELFNSCTRNADAKPSDGSSRYQEDYREHCLRGADRNQRIAPPQRHDSISNPGDLSDSQRVVSPHLYPGGAHHIDIPADRVVAAAVRWPLHGSSSQAVFARNRDGIHPDRAASSVDGAEFPDDPLLRGAGRHGFIYLSSGSFPPGPDGVRWTPRICPVDFSGGRQRRNLFWPAVGSPYYRAAGSIQRRLVLRHRLAGDHCSLQCGSLVQAQPSQDQGWDAPQGSERPTNAVPPKGRTGTRGSRSADVLEILLHREHDELLHLLPDR